MNCIDTIGTKQTEFEFYQQLINSPNMNICCGPKLHIVFNEYNASIIDRLFNSVGLPLLQHLDSFEAQMLDSACVKLTMCSRHWLQLQDLLYMENEMLSQYILNLVVMLNGWDSKEIANYLS